MGHYCLDVQIYGWLMGRQMQVRYTRKCQAPAPLAETSSPQCCWPLSDQTCQQVLSTTVQQNLTSSLHPLGADCRHIEQF